LLTGDLNVLQQEALQWLLIDEGKNEAEVFETQLRFMVLAGNPQLYQHIWPDDPNEDIEWLVPQSEEELEAILSQLDQIASSESELQVGHDQKNSAP